jgi:hypothetical protein
MRRIEQATPLPYPERRKRAGSRRLWRERRAARPTAAPIVRFRLAALFAAQFFDLGTFTRMVDRHGIHAEMNPIVAQGFDNFGLPLVVFAKLMLVVLVGSIVVVLASESPRRRANPGLATVVTLMAVGAGLLGGLSNLGV